MQSKCQFCAFGATLAAGATAHMTSRRRFIAESLVALGSLSSRWPDVASASVRIGTYVPLEAGDLEAGLTFGASESERSASLFGWSVHRVRVASSDWTADPLPFDALIVGGRTQALPAGVPVLRVACDAEPEGPNVFTIAPCDATSAAGDDRTHRIVAWHDSLERFGAEQLNDRYRGATGRAMTSESWIGWFAMKLLTESALRAKSSEPRNLLAFLNSSAATFDGHKGASLRFDGRRHLQQPLYLLARSNTGDWTVQREIAAAPASP